MSSKSNFLRLYQFSKCRFTPPPQQQQQRLLRRQRQQEQWRIRRPISTQIISSSSSTTTTALNLARQRKEDKDGIICGYNKRCTNRNFNNVPMSNMHSSSPSSPRFITSSSLPLLQRPERRSIYTTAITYDKANATPSDFPFECNRDTGIVTNQQQSYQTIIGIELHIQLSVPTKLLSSSPTKHSTSYTSSSSPSPNTLVSPFDLAYPGTLPSPPTPTTIQAAILTAAALNCTIHDISRFERKHYSYPDLPAGYQVTQQRWPLASDGVLRCRRFQTHEEKKKKKKKKKSKKKKKKQQEEEEKDEMDKFFEVGIERIQLEQDTGKTTSITTNTTSNSTTTTTTTTSYIDLNRAGTTLIEIVFRPDVRSAHKAASVVSTVQQLLKHIHTCDGKLEEGSIRCDLNVSIVPLHDHDHDHDTPSATKKVEEKEEDNPFQSHLPHNVGQRVEIKNLNSLRQIIQATEYESKRQAMLHSVNTPTERETKTFDVKLEKTVLMRKKGDAVDYRFMPEPDLPPIILSSSSSFEKEEDNFWLGGKYETVEEFVMMKLPELPEEAVERLQQRDCYGLEEEMALLITADKFALDLYEVAVEVCRRDICDSFVVVGDDDNDGNNDMENETKKEMKKEEQLNKVPLVVANWLCNDLFGLVKDSATSSSTTTTAATATQKEKDKNSANNNNNNNDEDDEESAAAASSGSGKNLNHPISVQYSTVDGQRLGSLLALVITGTVSTTQAKKILHVMYYEDLISSPLDISESKGWKLISDITVLQTLCERVLKDEQYKSQLDQYRKGGRNVDKIEKFFLGKVMGESRGNAHPEVMKDVLKGLLNEFLVVEEEDEKKKKKKDGDGSKV